MRSPKIQQPAAGGNGPALTKEQRQEIARKAAAARWRKEAMTTNGDRMLRG